MPKAAFTLAWSAESETYELSERAQGETRSFTPDSPAPFAWLAEVSSFAFHGRAGSFTALQEKVQRGERYWYAYRRAGQQVRKKYLGKTADLTLARLEQVAELLAAERTPAGSPASTLPSPVAPAEPEAALPADPFSALLSTRLVVPRPPARLVPRSRLIDRLSAGLAQPLILLSAPAGYGKTTLLAAWLRGCGLPVAWLSLDAEDNDPLRFLTTLLAALQRCDPTLGASLRPFLASPRGIFLPAVFGLLSGEIAERDSEFLLVLDDSHLLSDASIQQALAWLVEHCPPNLHLVLSTRADPQLPLARLRARGQMCELRAADLQFDAEEAHAFLITARARELSAATEATILAKTEGWVAGLQLTALSLQGRQSPAEVRQFLTAALDTQRHLVDYLVEEVLSQQPEVVQVFLLRTSILDTLCASLAAAVTEARSQQESAALLTHLERANLFLFPLDTSGEWYRYHPLWASVLRVLLVHRLGEAEVSALYGRASRWYEQHNLPVPAIEAALAAGDFERAAQLIEPLSPLLVSGQYLVVRRWIERLPPDEWRTRPFLCLWYAMALFRAGQFSLYQSPLESAEQLFAREGLAIGVGLSAALRAVAASVLGEGKVAIEASRQALALLPPTQLLGRSTSMSALGTGYWLLGEVVEAAQTFREARTLHEQAGNLDALLADHHNLGSVLMWQGKLALAAATNQQVIEQAGPWRSYAILALIHLAEIHYEWNDLDEAEAMLARALAEADQVAEDMLLAQGVLSRAYAVQGCIRQTRGKHAEASALFTQAVAQARLGGHARLPSRMQGLQVRWWLAQGHLEAARRWRESETLARNTTPSFEQEPGALTEARVLIAEGETGEALWLLERFRTYARTQGRLDSELRILALCALAETRRGRTEPAVQHLGQALALAEPAGYVRLFLDEGPPLVPLLRLMLTRWQGQRRAHYVQQLLTLIEAEHPEFAGAVPGNLSPATSRISGRELEVLRGLAEGLSTPQLAARLVVSPNTIKTQRESLYRKLDARTREEALAQAARLHLL